jgi:hypothetical protein
MNLYALMAASAVFGGSLALVGCFVSHVLRTFGWDALFVKGAALFDGMLIGLTPSCITASGPLTSVVWPRCSTWSCSTGRHGGY